MVYICIRMYIWLYGSMCFDFCVNSQALQASIAPNQRNHEKWIVEHTLLFIYSPLLGSSAINLRQPVSWMSSTKRYLNSSKGAKAASTLSSDWDITWSLVLLKFPDGAFSILVAQWACHHNSFIPLSPVRW